MINQLIGSALVAGIIFPPLFIGAASNLQANPTQAGGHKFAVASSNYVSFHDGINDYLQSSDLKMQTSQGFAYSIWVRPNSAGGLSMLRTGGSPDRELGIRNHNGVFQVTTYAVQRGITGTSLASLGINVFDGKFHNFIYTCSAFSCATYVDGKLAHTTLPSAVGGELNFLLLGVNTHSPFKYLSGLIDSVSVFRIPITSSQAGYIYNHRNDFTRYESGFHSWWNFDDVNSLNLINEAYKIGYFGGAKRQLN